MASLELEIDGTIINANKRFLDALGYSLTEVKGKHHRIFVDQNYAESNEYLTFWKLLKQGKAQTGDFTRYGKNGIPLKVTANYAPILDENGKAHKIINFAQVISQVYAY